MYTQVQNESDHTKKLEEHYLDATNKVASIPKNEIPKRVDYQVVSTTATQGRRIRKLTKKVTQKLIEEYNDLKKKIVEFFQNFKQKLSKFFSNLMENIDQLVKESPEKLMKLLNQMKNMLG